MVGRFVRVTEESLESRTEITITMELARVHRCRRRSASSFVSRRSSIDSVIKKMTLEFDHIEGQVLPSQVQPKKNARVASTDASINIDVIQVPKSRCISPIDSSLETFEILSLSELESSIENLQNTCWISEASSVTQSIQNMLQIVKSSVHDIEDDSESENDHQALLEEIMGDIEIMESMLY